MQLKGTKPVTVGSTTVVVVPGDKQCWAGEAKERSEARIFFGYHLSAMVAGVSMSAVQREHPSTSGKTSRSGHVCKTCDAKVRDSAINYSAVEF